MADVAMAVLTLAMVVVFAAGLRRAGASVALIVKITAALVAWLSIVAALALAGVFSFDHPGPPRWVALPLTALVVTIVTLRLKTTATLIAATPLIWPIAVQVFRIGVELALFSLHREGRAPVQITFEGQNFDIAVGVTAPLIAWLLASKRISPSAALAWNAVSLTILLVTIGTVATSAPGPLHRDWPGAPFTAIAHWPIVWLPAFLAPLAIFLHLVSMRQLFKDRAADPAP